MSSHLTNPEEQNDQLLRLIAANKARLAKLQQTIADLQRRTENTGEEAHFWERNPKAEEPLLSVRNLSEKTR